MREAENINASNLVEPNPHCWDPLFSEFRFSEDIWA